MSKPRWEAKRKWDQERRQELVYRVLWGNYAEYSCLPEYLQDAVDQVAESPYIDFDRLQAFVEKEA